MKLWELQAAIKDMDPTVDVEIGFAETEPGKDDDLTTDALAITTRCRRLLVIGDRREYDTLLERVNEAEDAAEKLDLELDGTKDERDRLREAVTEAARIAAAWKADAAPCPDDASDENPEWCAANMFYENMQTALDPDWEPEEQPA